jgi:hypothetical protein
VLHCIPLMGNYPDSQYGSPRILLIKSNSGMVFPSGFFSKGVYQDILCNVFGFIFMLPLICFINNLVVLIINKVILFEFTSWVLG